MWRLMTKIIQFFIVLSTLLLVVSAAHKDLPPTKTKVTKSLATLEPLLLVSTLDGSLHSVSSKTGAVKWKLDESPVITIPRESTTTMKGPTFLPDPHDGSLYAFEPSSESITKLPFTIQELVKASPLKTVEGILYTGRKQDVWYGLDPLTGKKQKVLTTCKLTETCDSSNSDQRMYIGRSEYQVTMYDAKNGLMHWNVTFADYSSHINENNPRSSDHLHLTSSADGYMVSVDRKTGKVLWAQNYGYPVVAIYAWQPDGGLYRLELTSVADSTLMNLLTEAKSRESSSIFLNDLNFSPKENMLAPSLYIGQYKNGLYALPALTHSEVKLNGFGNVKMLPGPDGEEDGGGLSPTKSSPHDDTTSPVYESWRLIGYYKSPPLSKITLPATSNPPLKPPRMAIGYDQLDPDVDPVCVSAKDDGMMTASDGRETDKMPHHFYPPLPNEEDNKHDEEDTTLTSDINTILNINTILLDWIREINLTTAALAIVLTYVLFQKFSGWNRTKEKDGNTWMRVGQIRINLDKTLGHGSQGTEVYSGIFDDREVAIKRIVSSNCTFADREVALLRESDRHLNVVRYYCTEKDRGFQYIALELCAMTLKQYVENKDIQERIGLDVKKILDQAMQGLHHLHQLKIVHRDVKPSNILISNDHRVVLSDFGLCKKVRGFDASFSAKSGMAGTQGWIAPELLQDSSYRMTQAVDIFSMGCVFHYVICGKHPFGGVHERQYRIINGKYDLTQIKDYQHYEEAADIIRRMISIPPNSRPKTEQILAHPLFWDSVKTLQFFEDVSDRVEKETDESSIVKILDRNMGDDEECSVAYNWQERICKPLQEDLKKFRTYRTDSVKDLLRAIRNKKHHYEELPDDVKSSLGLIPNEFLAYFIKRFPSIVVHTYISMAAFQHDIRFKSYYGSGSSPSATVRTSSSKYRPTASSSKPQSPADLDMNWRERKPLQPSSEANSIYQPPLFNSKPAVTTWAAPPSPRVQRAARQQQQSAGAGDVKATTVVATVTASSSPVVSYARAVAKSMNVAEEEPIVEEEDGDEEEEGEEENEVDVAMTEEQDDDSTEAEKIPPPQQPQQPQQQQQAADDEEAAAKKTKHKKNRRHKKKKLVAG